jgi:hypothetical protein
MLTDLDPDVVEREILEVLKRIGTSRGILPNPSLVLGQTPSIASWKHDWRDHTWRFKRLEKKEMIRILGEDTTGDFGMLLDTEGEVRLSMPEAEYQRRNNPQSGNTFNIRRVENLANATGAYSQIHQTTNRGVDADTVAKLIRSLVNEIKSHDEIPSEDAEDAIAEADILARNLERPKPTAERIKTALDYFKTLSSAYSVLAPPVEALVKTLVKMYSLSL